MSINTEILEKCILTWEKSYVLIKASDEGLIDYEMYRNSLVKCFELILGQAGKLLKKRIVSYFPSNKAVDSLTFKEIM